MGAALAAGARASRAYVVGPTRALRQRPERDRQVVPRRSHLGPTAAGNRCSGRPRVRRLAAAASEAPRACCDRFAAILSDQGGEIINWRLARTRVAPGVAWPGR